MDSYSCSPVRGLPQAGIYSVLMNTNYSKRAFRVILLFNFFPYFMQLKLE